MQETSPRESPKISRYIPQKPVYTTQIRFLSLIDTCIHYIIHHPEISTISLPLELQEHMEKRRSDEMYRVLPAYSLGDYQIVSNEIIRYLDRIALTNRKDNRINAIIDMLKFVDENLDILRYDHKYANTLRKKLIDIIDEGFPIAVSQHYLLKWFDYKLALPPPLAPPP